MKAAAIEFRPAAAEHVKAVLVALCLLLLLAALAFGISRQPWPAAGDATGAVQQDQTQDVQDIDPFALPSISNTYLTGM